MWKRSDAKSDVGQGAKHFGHVHDSIFDWKGVTRAWRYSKKNMERLEQEGRLVYSKTGMVYQKRYLDESKGVALSSWWDDIDMLRGITSGGERLG